MRCDVCGALTTERKVRYTLETEGKLIVVENVPARVCTQCGEKLFSPETVELLQRIVWEQKEPAPGIQTPVFDFASRSLGSSELRDGRWSKDTVKTPRATLSRSANGPWNGLGVLAVNG